MGRDFSPSSSISIDCSNTPEPQSTVSFREHSDPEYPGCSVAFLSAPSTSYAVTELRQRVMSYLATPELAAQQLADLELAIGEACTNAVRHGSPGGALDQVRMKCVKEAHSLVVEICDSGYGFDPSSVPPPSPEEMKEGGMGIFLMRSCVDKVEFEFGSGTTVRLVKYCRRG